MEEKKEMKMKRHNSWFISLGVLLLILFIGLNYHIYAKSSASNKSKQQWVAPKEAAQLKSPVPATKQVLEEGKKIYLQQCATCHGKSGKGDGPAGKYLGKRPVNFTSPSFQKQSDGEIFWKINHGNSPMPSFKQILDQKQIWEVVKYLRTFGSK